MPNPVPTDRPRSLRNALQVTRLNLCVRVLVMTPYRNLSRDSGVLEYESGPDYIKVRYRDGSTYVYDHRAPGQHHVAQMKQRAVAGRGLATYISQNVKKNYSRKE